MTKLTKRGWAAWATRDILILAIVGLVFGLVLAPFFAFSTALDAALGPVMKRLLSGVFFIPGFLAAYALRKPGAAVLCSLLMGLSIAPVAPTGLLTVVGTALFGFIAELPFLITRYRNYGSRFLLAASGVIGLLTGLMDFVPNGGFNLEPVSQVLFLLLNTISGVLGMLVARALSRVLVNAGVLRGYAIANSTPEI